MAMEKSYHPGAPVLLRGGEQWLGDQAAVRRHEAQDPHAAAWIYWMTWMASKWLFNVVY